jgi:hypothetical protein
VPGGRTTVTGAPPTAARPLTAPFVAIAVGLVALAAIVGFVASGSGDGEDSATAGNVAAGGSVRLRFPATWEAGAAPPDIQGLSFADPVALTPRTATGRAGLVAGVLDFGTADLAPDDLGRRLGTPPPQREAVDLGAAQAFRYAGLRPRGFGGVVTLHVVPTTAGLTGLACHAATTASESIAECERIVASLEVTNAKPLDIRPSAAYARGLSSTLATLARARTSGLRRFAAVETAAGQVAPARALARTYAAAERQVARLPAPPLARRLNGLVADSMRATRRGYERIATAARSHDESGYRSARQAVRRADESLRDALRRLAGIGYRTG